MGRVETAYGPRGAEAQKKPFNAEQIKQEMLAEKRDRIRLKQSNDATGKPPKRPPNRSPKTPPNTPIRPLQTGGPHPWPKPTQPVVSPKDSIRDNWANLTKSARDKLEQQYNRDQAEYAKQGRVAAQEFKGMQNQATVGKAMQERVRKEQMANMGMSTGGGTSRTFAQRNANNLNNQLGSISRQKRDYKENVNSALANLRGKYDAEGNAIEAQNNASSMNAQMQYEQWKQGFDQQQQQMDMSRDQWEKSFTAQQENAAFDQAMALYRSKKITRKQFEAIANRDIW
ncbi:MAG: hypothetical protein HN389_12200 [Clostridia bacterium]|jgi:hypothetical protein|nr:hypothetical protein [Clostridia bacterium]